MSKKLLIDTNAQDETRIALLNEGKLDDFEIELNKTSVLKGDVYLAKITRVEPSLQAAFVDFGVNRNGFLPLTEIHPDYFQIPISDQEILKKLSSEIKNDEINNDDDNENNNEILIKDNEINENDFNKKQKNKFENRKKYFNFIKKYKIQEVIKPRQVILVQINKEERGLKGAALTTFLSFPGRYCVLMPNSQNKDGISRKITNIDERNKLKKIIETINIPENMTVIVRTAGIGKTKKEINKDFQFLISQWNKIRQKTLKSTAPCLIYEDGNLIKRTIRDLLSSDVNEVIIDGKEGYNIAKKFAKELVPSLTKKIKLFKRNKKTLFNENNIENQINDLFSLKVNLPSGGSIVINTTEALVAIDVNSGKNTMQRNIESTALNTNLEAAEEIARQLRLRDLGGLNVIDFIDMDDYRNNFKVERALKTALNQDRARIQVGRISMFGLLELSRQRLRSSLIERSFQKCQLCNGSGITLNPLAISEQILKVVAEKLANNKNSKIEVKCNSYLSEFLLNDKRDELQEIEKLYNSKIKFNLNNLYSLHQPEISLLENKKKSLEENEIKNKKITKKQVVKKEKIKKTKEVKKKVYKKKFSVKFKKRDDLNEMDINDEKSQKTGWWAK